MDRFVASYVIDVGVGVDNSFDIPVLPFDDFKNFFAGMVVVCGVDKVYVITVGAEYTDVGMTLYVISVLTGLD